MTSRKVPSIFPLRQDELSEAQQFSISIDNAEASPEDESTENEESSDLEATKENESGKASLWISQLRDYLNAQEA